jgi:membrane associated rhomboid family serine protease
MAYPFRDERPPTRATWATWLLLAACLVVFAFLQPKAMQGLTRGLNIQDNAAALIQKRHFEDRWALVPCELTHGTSIRDGAACDGYRSDTPGAYAEKNVYTPLLSALFLHDNLLHLLGNLLFLWVFGRGLERRLGAPGVLALFVAGGIAASLGYVMVNPESTTPMLGASGAIAALMGAYLVLQPTRRILTVVYAAGLQFVYLPAWAVLAFFFVSQFFTAPETRVAWEAHVAGMIFGVVVAAVLCWRDPSLRPRFDPTDAPVAPMEAAARTVPTSPWPTALPPGPPS